MRAWLRARATEANSRRAGAVIVALGGYFGYVDPAQLTNAGAVVAAVASLWLAIDAFLTKPAPPQDKGP